MRRLLDNSGGEGADRARALITSPSGTSQHAGYEAHLNRTEFTDLVRPVPHTIGGARHEAAWQRPNAFQTVAAEGARTRWEAPGERVKVSCPAKEQAWCSVAHSALMP